MLLKNGYICDFRGKKKADVRIKNGTIIEIGNLNAIENENIIDCQNKVILPSLIDMVYPKNKTLSLSSLESLVKKAKSGGVGTILLYPDTTPPIDAESMLEFVRSADSNYEINLFPSIATLKDGNLNNLATLKTSGAKAFISDSNINSFTLLKIAQYANMLNMPLIFHTQDSSLSDGVMNESPLSFKLGLPAINSLSQSIEVAKLCELSRFSKTEIIFSVISEIDSINIIKKFKEMGAKIKTQTSIHHLILSQELCEGYDTSYKIFPPLKDENTIKFLKENLNDNIDMLTALQCDSYKSLKDQVFELASFGVNAISFYFSLGYEFLVKSGVIDLARFSYLTSKSQSKILGLNKGEISEGFDADLIVVDLDSSFVVNEAFNPYNNMRLSGVVTNIINSKW